MPKIYKTSRKKLNRRYMATSWHGASRGYSKPSLSAALRLRNIRRKRATSRLRRRLGVEKKEKRYTLSPSQPITSTVVGATIDTNVRALCPNPTTLTISQGTGQGDRLGNKIKLTDAYLTFSLMPEPYNGLSTNQPFPCMVRVMMMYDKRNPTTAPTPGSNGDFFQNGNSVSGFTGTLQDFLMPINEDRYCVKWKRDYKIGWSVYQGVTGADPAQAYYANNDFKMLVKRKISYIKHLPKNWRFDDGDVDIQTRGLWWFAYAVICSPNTTSINANLVRLNYTFELKWTDL